MDDLEKITYDDADFFGSGEDVFEDWYKIDTASLALKYLLKEKNLPLNLRNEINDIFQFNSDLSFEENLNYIETQLLEHTNTKNISRELLEDYFIQINVVNDLKYGSNSFRKCHQYERDLTHKGNWKKVFQQFLIDNNIKKDGNILNVGVNDGEEIKDLNYNIVGIDLSKNAIEHAKKNIPGFTFMVGDANKLNFENNFFDTYISLRTFSVTSVRVKKALYEANRVLKEDGKIILSFPKVLYNRGDKLKEDNSVFRECDLEELVKTAKSTHAVMKTYFTNYKFFKNSVEDYILASK